MANVKTTVPFEYRCQCQIVKLIRAIKSWSDVFMNCLSTDPRRASRRGSTILGNDDSTMAQHLLFRPKVTNEEPNSESGQLAATIYHRWPTFDGIKFAINELVFIALCC